MLSVPASFDKSAGANNNVSMKRPIQQSENSVVPWKWIISTFLKRYAELTLNANVTRR